jgi:glycosyltransferase involved in cell wall biosynthesis
MKICIATHHFPPKYIGGAEQYAFRLARHLLRDGHEVEVVTIDSITQGRLEPDSRMDCYEGLTVHHLSFDLQKAERPFPLLYRNPYLGAWFRRYFEGYQPDLLHINSGYLLSGSVIEEGKAAGIPTALTLHEYWFLCPLHTLLRTNGMVCEEPVSPARCKWCLMGEKRRYRMVDEKTSGRVGNLFVRAAAVPGFKQRIEKDALVQEIAGRKPYLQRVYTMIDLVISPSKFLIEKMEAYGFHHSNCVYLPYGLENIPDQVPAKEREPGRLRVGYLGRISKEKGVDVLIRAVRAIPKANITLAVYGHIDMEEPYHRSLLKLAKKDPRIQFRGRYTQSELPMIMQALDATVVPSRWYENRPGTVLEPFAYHTPVVASRLGGMIELIQHNVNGLLFAVNDVDDLSGQLRRLLDEPDLLQTLKKGILPVARVEDEIQQTQQHYQGIIKTGF